MAVQVDWDNSEQTILRYNFDAKWSWDDFYEAYYQAINMVNSVTHRVEVIFDMRKSRRLPDSALLHLRNLSDKQPSNIGKSVFVSDNTFIVSLFTLAMKNHAKIAHYFRLVNTIEAAYELIAQQQEVYDLKPM